MDDGAVDLETAIEMARLAIADGITTTACTPHIVPSVYDNARLACSGAMVQLTAASLTGRFGPSVQQLSERMLSDGLIHLLASDGHNLTGRRPTMSRAREVVAERLGTEEADHMVRTRPEGILQDKPLTSLPPTIRTPSRVGRSRLGWRRFLPLSTHGNHGPGAYRSLASVAGLSLLLAGCVSAGEGGGTARVASLPPPDLVAVSAVQTQQRVGAMDTLEVAILQAPELNRTVQVDASGQISLPLLGNVRVSGRTVRELEADLAGRYGAKYLQSPQVTVAVKESPSRSLTVEGAVRKPGIYPVAGQSTLLKAIALSGGLDPISDPSAVMIFRTANKQRVSATFNMRPIRSGEAPDPDVYPGDVIVVGESAMRVALRDIGTVMPVAGLLRPF